MARSLSLANRLGALAAYRRGYAAASDGSMSAGLGRVGSSNGVVGKHEERALSKQGSEPSCAWGPDPVTGYYRPINHSGEIDPVELREMLVNPKVRGRM